jgi:hypothetical protein
MTGIGEKAAHVREAMGRNETFDHHCHWTGCQKKVPPAVWGCKQHWYRLPLHLRRKIWRAYKPGQEVTKTPSAEYLAVAREVREWIEQNDAPLLGSSR